MDSEEFKLLFIKIEGQQMAMQSFADVLVQRLARDCGLNVEMLLEHLYTAQSNIPGLQAGAAAGQAAIAKEYLAAFGSILQGVESASVSLSTDSGDGGDG